MNDAADPGAGPGLPRCRTGEYSSFVKAVVSSRRADG